MLRYLSFLLLAFALGCQSDPSGSSSVADNNGFLFVGTYTQRLGHVDGKASGIYTCTFDTVAGTLRLRDSVAGIANPSFICLSPDKRFLFAVGENGGTPEQPYGSVVSYKIDDKGHLTKINEMPSYGAAPCHISTDRTGKFAFVANYSTGNVVSYRIKTDGTLSDSICTRQHPGKQTWAHQIIVAPDNRHVWAVDKGADRVFLYELQVSGHLKPLSSLETPKGAGPRHLDFHPGDPSLMAVVNELNSTVMTFRYSAEQQKYYPLGTASTLPAGYSNPNSCADIHFHPNKTVLYASNRGMDNIAVFELDPLMGQMKLTGHSPTLGATPRSFMLTRNGKWMLVAHQNSGTIAVFSVDKKTGALTQAGAPVAVSTPVCLKM